jgi:hypothetical protein
LQHAQTANQHNIPNDEVILRIKGTAAWKQIGSKAEGHWALFDSNRSLRRRNNNKYTISAMMVKKNGLRIMLR